jgi:hypothetical protein
MTRALRYAGYVLLAAAGLAGYVLQVVSKPGL